MLRTLAAILLLAAAAPASTGPVTALAGRYYAQFPNGTVDGESYVGEDVVEIVPVSPAAAYIRADLSFYNGHSCLIHGIAEAAGDRLVYRDREAGFDGRPCVLTVRRFGRSLRLDDADGGCRIYCGARGGFADHDLPFASRRPIRYLPRLKASAEFREAMAGWRR